MDLQTKAARRLALLDERVRRENAHDLEGVMQTFAANVRYEDLPAGETHVGVEAVRGFYRRLMHAMPDLHIDVQQRHAGEETVILELVIRGHHLGTWRGLPPTGRRLEVQICAVFSFDATTRVTGERIYYDRAAVLRQLGVLHDPEGFLGRLTAVVMHPGTLARIAARALFGRRSAG